MAVLGQAGLDPPPPVDDVEEPTRKRLDDPRLQEDAKPGSDENTSWIDRAVHGPPLFGVSPTTFAIHTAAACSVAVLAQPLTCLPFGQLIFVPLAMAFLIDLLGGWLTGREAKQTLLPSFFAYLGTYMALVGTAGLVSCCGYFTVVTLVLTNPTAATFFGVPPSTVVGSTGPPPALLLLYPFGCGMNAAATGAGTLATVVTWHYRAERTEDGDSQVGLTEFRDLFGANLKPKRTRVAAAMAY